MKKIAILSMLFLMALALTAGGSAESVSIQENETLLSDFAISRTEMSVKEAAELFNAGLDRKYIKWEGKALRLANDFGDILIVISGNDMQIVNDRIAVVEGRGDMPVRCISNLGAAALCNIKSLEEGIEPYYDYYFEPNSWAKGYRLPTMEEWERAAKGGDDRMFAWGNSIAEGGDKANTAYMYSGDKYDYTRILYKHEGSEWEVTKGAANPYGLFNMTGNVSEWTSTEYHGPIKLVNSQHFTKGGNHYQSAEELNINNEVFSYSCELSPLTGFRWVRSL